MGFKPKGGVEFNGIDASDCCNGIPFSATVPPDVDMAAGPNHLIVVVNVAFEIFDKKGNSLTGPVSFADFFDGTPGCSALGTFDPDVVYDTVNDRFRNSEKADKGKTFKSKYQSGTGKIKGFFKLF